MKFPRTNSGLVFLATLMVFGFAATSQGTQFEQDCAQLRAKKGEDGQRLHALFKLDWEHTMQESPEFATIVGYPGQNDRWSDVSLEAIDRRKKELQAPMQVIQSIDRAKLSAADQLNYDLFRKNQQDAIEGTRFKQEYMQITQMGGVQQEVARVIELSPRARLKDYQDMLSRLKAVPNLIDQTITLLNKGLEAGITPPRITLRDVPQQISNQMIDEQDKSAMLKPFIECPLEIPKAQQEPLRKQAQTVLKDQVVPSFRKLYD